MKVPRALPVRLHCMNKKTSKAVVYYPIFLNLRDRRCIVIGGGMVALRKVKMLINCGASVTVVSPKPHPDITELSKKKAIHLILRDYEPGDLQWATIAIATTNVEKINRRVAHEAKKNGILVNVADNLRSSDFIIPSSFRRGNLTIAVSTAGMSPAFAKKIRMRLEKRLGEEYGSLLSLISEVRSALKEKGCTVDGEAWQKALDLKSLIRLIHKGQREKTKANLIRKLEPYHVRSKRESPSKKDDL